jgi:cytolysin-activating lysine-acyltransferase
MTQQNTDSWATFDFSHPHGALGAMAWLMQHADYHRRWSLHAVNVDIVPAIVLGQYRIYHTPEGEPIGFVTWAYVNDEVKDILIHRRRPMTQADWRSGDLLMFNDFVAPFGHGRWIVNELRSTLFANNVAFSLRRQLGGGVRKVNRWEGIAYRQETKRKGATAPFRSPPLGDIPPKTRALA